MSGACQCPKWGVVRQNKGQLLPTTPLHKRQAQNQGWRVTEARGTHRPVTTRVRCSQTVCDQRPGHTGPLCAPSHAGHMPTVGMGRVQTLSKNFTEDC